MPPFRPLAICIGLSLAPAILALGGCQKSVEPTAEPSAAASTAAKAMPGLSLTDARLALPAVGGRPGAVYFTLRNTAAAPATIAAIEIDGTARAEMHESVAGTMKPLASLEVPAGGTVAFTPGGKHVMVFGLAPSLVAGGSTGMTLRLADGSKLSAPVAVRAPGDGGGKPMTMDMH